eukprot:365179-Chlamydomonas_euryale.AAC.7
MASFQAELKPPAKRRLQRKGTSGARRVPPDSSLRASFFRWDGRTALWPPPHPCLPPASDTFIRLPAILPSATAVCRVARSGDTDFDAR